MKAVVMAGGSGSRLRPLTVGRPKPMVPLINQPVMAHIRDLLKRHGITEMVCTVQYMADIIRGYFGEGQDSGMKIVYSEEESPLGTAGSVKLAEQYLDDTFLVISGDAVTDFDLTAIVDFHKRVGAIATLTLYRVPNPLEYGVIIIDDEGRIQEFQEKPSWGEVISDTVNTGIYVLEPEVLNHIPSGESFDFSKDLFPILLRRGDPMYGYVASGYWCDVGNISEYIRATSDVLHAKANVEELGKSIGGGITTGQDVDIAPDAQLYGPVFLGQGVQIKGGVIVRGPTVIRDFTIVDNHAHIDRSIIWRNSYIGEGAQVHGAVICRQCSIKSKAALFEGVVLGDHSSVGKGAVIHSNVKIWPEKEIEEGATVKSSVIWGAQGRKVLFSRFGVTGLVNIDLTPESAAKLGAAFAATLPKGAKVTVNRDINRSARMIKRGMIAGLPSASIHPQDLRCVPIPVARYITRISDCEAGIHVRISPYDARVVDIRFFDKNGMNLSKSTERSIERTYFREDYRRAFLDEVGVISYAPEVVERYKEGFLRAVDVAAIREAGFNIVVDYAHAPTSLVLPSILAQLGCHVVGLNAQMDEAKLSILKEEFDEGCKQLALICNALASDLAVRLDVGGEKVFAAVNDRRDRLDDVTVCAAVADLALRARRGGTVAVPVNMPRVFEEIAARHGGHILRTKVDLQALMTGATQEGIIMAGDGTGNFIFPEFQPAVDGLFAVAKILELLATQRATFAGVVNGLPAFFTAQHTIPCAWDAKGTVMRRLNERFRDQEEKQIDGVRITLGDDWVLILPDPDQPVLHVFAESRSQRQASDLADQYASLVEELRG